MFFRKALSELVDRRVELEGALDESRQLDEPAHETALALCVSAVVLRQGDNEHRQRCELRREKPSSRRRRFPGRHASGDMTSSDSRQPASFLRHVADREGRQVTRLLREPQGSQRVSGLARDCEIVTNREFGGTSGLR